MMPKQNSVRAGGTESACVIQVIETTALRGSGLEGDPVRAIKQYWKFNGELLAEFEVAKEEAQLPVREELTRYKDDSKWIRVHRQT